MVFKFQFSETLEMVGGLQRILGTESVWESLNSLELHLKFFADGCNGNTLE